jgi:hypothetical protein
MFNMFSVQDVSDEMREAVIDVTGERPEEIIADALLQGGPPKIRSP